MRKYWTFSKMYLCLMLFILQAGISFAQNALKGQVTDSSGIPLAGASVVVKGTSTGTITDQSGNFTLRSANGSTLVFSMIGYNQQEAVASAGIPLVIKLMNAANTTEVVVTALGIRKEKKALGFATQEVKGAALEKAREPNVVAGLNGRVAGLTVSNSSTLFENPGLTLRGAGTLLVIDGIVSSGDLWNLNPDDIESINVLKSNAAALLYGSPGVNGAIQITTKKGKSGAKGVEVSVNQSLQFQGGFLKMPETQNQYGMGFGGYYAFIDGAGGGGWYDNYGYVWGPKLNQPDPTTASGFMEVPQYNSPYDANQLFEFKQNGYTDYSHYKPIPWISRGSNNLKNFLQKEMLSTTNVSVAGRSDYGEYRISLSHMYQKGQVPNTKLNSTTLNVSGNLKITEKIKAEASVSYNKQYTPNYPTTGYGPSNFFYNILLWMGPDVDIRDMKNYWKPNRTNLEQLTYNYSWYNNPYYMANENLRGYSNDVVVAQTNINWELVKGLNLMVRTGGTYNNVNADLKTPYSFIDYSALKYGQYSLRKSDNLSITSEAMLTYKTKFLNSLDLTASAGAANRYERYSSLNSSTVGGLQTPTTYNLANSRDPITSTNSLTERQVKSMYGYVDLGFKDMIYLNVSVRNDWTTTLRKPNNSFLYPSASLGLIVSEMIKMPEVISFAKIRGAYADVSSDLGAYDILPVYSPGTRWSGTPSLTLPGNIFDNNIKPNKTISREVGAELKFFKNRFGIDATYYNYLDKNSKRSIPLSQASGYNYLVVNGDILMRQGIELTLTASPIRTKSFRWDITANYNRYRHTVKEYYGGDSIRGTVKVGERIDTYTGYAWERSPDGEIVYNSNGMPKYINQVVNLGYAGSNWDFGLQNAFTYKNFSLSFLFDGRIGGKMFNGVEGKMYEGGMHPATANSNRDDAYAGNNNYVGNGVVVTAGSVQYDIQGKVVSDTRKFAPNTTGVNYIDYIFATYTNGVDQALQYDKTFVKLREVVLGYNLPSSFLGGKFFKSASVSVVGRNLLMFTKVPFMDPDGYDGTELAEPSYRNIGFNLNLKF